jgi:hypothetical protein
MSNESQETDPELYKPGRQVVPSGHAPRLDSTFVAQLHDGDDALLIYQPEKGETAWIQSPDHVYVEP